MKRISSLVVITSATKAFQTFGSINFMNQRTIMSLAGVLMVSSCSSSAKGLDDFKKHCASIATVEIVSQALWKEYLTKIKEQYIKAGIENGIRLEPAEGFSLNSSSAIDIKDIRSGEAYDTAFILKKNDKLVAKIKSSYISFSHVDGAASFECARDFPEFYHFERGE